MKTKMFLTFFASFLLILSTFAVIYKPSVHAQTSTAGNLTGQILDHGVDTRGNGLYDYLEIDFQVNVNVAGDFILQAYTLQDALGRTIYIMYNTTVQENLTVGIQYLNITVLGPEIFSSHLNPQNVSEISLRYMETFGYVDYLGGIDSIALSRVYNYTEFDPPKAYLTGNILDRGVDTNGDGLYDYLEVDVEINVTTASEFQTQIFDLLDKSGNTIAIPASSQGNLNVGIQYMNVSFSGPKIFSSRLNPQNVSSISLYDMNSTNNVGNYLDSISSATLSRVYNYTEFDPPKAYLTGNVSDRGVDTDGDGLFDYLQVGIQFNVTQAGDYGVTAGGLSASSGGLFQNIFYDSQTDLELCQPGVHTAYLNFSGPGIRQSQVDPAYVEELQLLDYANLMSLDSLNSVPLSKTYDYTLFDAPSRNTQINVKVYPNATVAIDGTLNYTHMYPENTYYPQINATMGFSTTGNTTIASSNGTIASPQNPYFDNSLEEHASQTWENGLLNETSNTSVILRPEVAAIYPFNTTDFSLDATYSGGLFDVNLEGSTVLPPAYGIVSPFNMTDTTVQADFDGNLVNGNITFHTIPGLQFADVTLDFSGNRTSLQFTGNVNMTFANYGYFQIDKTSLDQKIADLNANFTGTGADSLYNETGGYLNCSNLVLTETPWSDPTQGANVVYNATVVGNFTAALASLIYPQSISSEATTNYFYALFESAASSVNNASVVLNYYHDSQTAQISAHLTMDAQTLYNELLQLFPPTISQLQPSPSEETQVEAILKIMNATANATTNASIAASYSSSNNVFSTSTSLTAKTTQLKQDIVPILPDLAPTGLHDVYQSFFNTTYGNTTALDSTMDITNGAGTFNSTATYQGQFEAEVNHIKQFYVAALNWTLGYPYDAANVIQNINETEIDLNNLQIQADIGQNWMYMNFSGLTLTPPTDKVDNVTFRLDQWLGAGSTLIASAQLAQFTVTFTGESSGNQTIILSPPPDSPPPSNVSTDYKTIVWNNTPLSNLQDLTFLLATNEQVNFNDQNYQIPIVTNSTVQDFTFDSENKRISFNVTGEPGTVGYCNVTIPRNLLNSDALNDWTITFDGNILPQNEFSITQNNDYVFIYLNYTHSEHVITISGTQVVTELQPDFLPLALATLLIITAIAAIRKRKPIKTKFTQTLATLRLHRTHSKPCQI
jgi:hypothetical protein